MSWESSWREFLEERKLSPEDKKAYFGTERGKHGAFGYNSPGVVPEIIWKDLPNEVYRNEIVRKSEIQNRKYLGAVNGPRNSLKSYGFDRGFWFTVGIKDFVGTDFYLEDPEEWEKKGKTAVRYIIPKSILNPKKVYIDIEGAPSRGPGRDKYYDGDLDSRDFSWFFYADIVPVSEVKMVYLKDLPYAH